jgi:LmbE family N-acetylglucosaminyl deacetylase
MRRAFGVVRAILAFSILPGAFAQRDLAGAARVQLALDRLQNPQRALMIAAHPDDENTALLAWLARGRNVRTAYLSITRGEGGQNLIGPEQGALLGVIRTQELLAARKIDGAEQFFTSAVDFGFAKSVEETLAKWGREKTLGEIVRVIREFRPHVIILRFSGTSRDGHGHHQASAILGKEAFAAAADPARFPEQLASLTPWQAKRILWNVFSFTREQEREAAAAPGRLRVDVGEYDALLGYSYAEIAGMSRSEHRSQGMGSPERRGKQENYLSHVAGEPAKEDLFEGVPAPQGERLIFDPREPENTVRALLAMRKGSDRVQEIDEAIALCAGLWLDASAARSSAVEGSDVPITIQAVNRSRMPMRLVSTSIAGPMDEALDYNRLVSKTVTHPAQKNMSARFQLAVDGEEITLERPVHHRFIDPVRGELTRPFAIVPAVSVRFGENPVIFAGAEPKSIDVHVRAYAAKQSGSIRLTTDGWKAEPESQTYALESEGEQAVLRFKIVPPSGSADTLIEAADQREVVVLDYPHIPVQTLIEPATTRVVRADVHTLAKRIGYVMGAGDEMPEALRQIGCEVTLLTAGDIAWSDLSRYDAVVTGVRAYNTRPELRSNHHRLLDYVKDGGTMVVQYNVSERNGMDGPGPYPFRIGRARVTVEESPVVLLKPDHPLLNRPNRITPADFEGWVQERGLYFASEWDTKYEAPIASRDPGEDALPGGLLYTRYGKGAYVFTAYSWFRQLPAGVPGAYRLFANLLSAGKTQ